MSVAEAVEHLLSTATPEEQKYWKPQLHDFEKLAARFMEQKDKNEFIHWDEIQPPTKEIMKNYSELSDIDENKLKEYLNKLVVIKLNGGLGTSMGCVGPKSIIAAHDGKSFLDLTVEQIAHLNHKYQTKIPLVLMNSFSTHKDTQKIIEKYQSNPDVVILTFMQSQYPRISQADFLPLAKSLHDDDDKWYPPGHGDFFNSFKNSGLLKTLIDQGKSIGFVSNIDNLGALVDDKILSFMLNNGPDFAMEVTPKTRNDVKGGTIISYRGNSKLLEIAQVPPEHRAEFESIKKFKIFNTNNIWLNLPNVLSALEGNNFNNLDIIVNKKNINGVPLIQLETAIGASIQCFNKSCAIVVPRRRFLPVKTTNELFIVQSDMYTCENGTLTMNPKREFPELPEVRLGANFKKVGEYQERVPELPEITDLFNLTCVGDVSFGKNIVLKGTVIIIAEEGAKIHIPDGKVLENNVVLGSTDKLIVLPHN